MFMSLYCAHFLLGWILLGMVKAGRPTARQSLTFDPSQIPEECQSACNSVVDNANTCTTFKCLCTPANDAAVLACVDCVTSSNHSATAIIDGQDILNQFASQCNLNNVSVSSLSASGVATVTGITTSNIDPPQPSSATSQTSQQASVTSPSPSTSASPSASSNHAPSIAFHWSLMWPVYSALVVASVSVV
ncbi:hypothetical protein DFH06DRAFT_322414 [Mycena polygramma]|nr:hypothetical protein DFH06DRAFT_322414 [Mycena polygramma]